MSDNIIDRGFGTPAEDEDMDVESIFGGLCGTDADPPIEQEPAPIDASAETADAVSADAVSADTESADTESSDANSGEDNAAPADTSHDSMETPTDARHDSTETPPETAENPTDTAPPIKTWNTTTTPEKPGKPARKGTGKKAKVSAAESTDEEPAKDLFALLDSQGEADATLPANFVR